MVTVVCRFTSRFFRRRLVVGVHIRTHVPQYDIKLPDFHTGATWSDVSPVELFIKVCRLSLFLFCFPCHV
jgi:hypothetical protein